MDALNTQRLAPLMPKLITSAQEFIADCEASGVKILITQGLRTWAEQGALFAQGRLGLNSVNQLRIACNMAPLTPAQNTLKVTNAAGGQSYHNFGVAFDIVPIDANGKAIWDTTAEEWQTAWQIGDLHTGSVNSRLDPDFVAKAICQDLGLSEGEDWSKFKDPPHFEMTGGVDLAVLRSLYKPNDLSACWNEIMMRL